MVNGEKGSAHNDAASLTFGELVVYADIINDFYTLEEHQNPFG